MTDTKQAITKALEILEIIHTWNGQDRDTDPDVEVLSTPSGEFFTLADLESAIFELRKLVE